MTISDETAELIMDQATAQTRTALPGVIKDYDKKTQTAKVKPAIDTPIKDSETGEVKIEEQPVISNCPVAWGSSNANSASITFPVSPGDECLIIWGEKAIDSWLSKGGDGNEPVELRQHDDSDAIVLPMLRSLPNALGSEAVDSNAVVIRGEDGTEIKLGSSNASDEVALAPQTAQRIQDLIDAISKMVTVFNTHTHPTPSGASSAPNASQTAPSDISDSELYGDGAIKGE